MLRSWYWSKWLTFSFAALLQLSSGLGYTFSIYSNDLKKHFDYSQAQIAGIGTACNVGGYMPIFAGLFYDRLKRYNQVGPMLTVMIGVVLQFGGYYGMWLAAMGKFECSYVGMLLLAMAACNGQAWYETAGLVTSVRNFETERGTVIGILKAFLGLSASAYITIYVSFIEPDAIRFLRILALAPTAVALFSGFFINYVPFIQIEPHTKSHAFHMIFTAVIALAFYQTVIAIARTEAQSINFWTGVLMTSAVAVLLLPVMAIPFIFGGPRAVELNIKSHHKPVRKGPMPSIAAHTGDDASRPLLGSSNDGNGNGEGEHRAINPVEKTPLQCMVCLDFWLLFLVNGISSGCGLTLLNNLGQQVIALGSGSKSSQAGYVSLFSVANCLSRLLAGFIPDRLMKSYGTSRTVSLIALSAMAAISAVVTAFSGLQLLNASAFLAGFAFGGMQGITPAITSELFGLENFATNYAIIQAGPAIGSYAMATSLAGAMYNWVMDHYHQKGHFCRGPLCFRYTFLIVAALAVVATIFATIVWARSREAYKAVIKVMMAERMKRGIKAEMEEAREILDAYVEENRALVELLARGRGHVQQLQQAALSFTPDDADETAMATAVRELTGLVDSANALLSGSKGLEQQYLQLPSYASQRLSLALEADPNASARMPPSLSSGLSGLLPRVSQRAGIVFEADSRAPQNPTARVGGAVHRLLQSSSQSSLSRAGGGSRRNDELMDV
mmetsp:Transcript_14199/g.42879  ORF Transcript_14199/g.42879 Transcript_14199/m.42879 type:complete len:728 (-) Transcript_14199:369-2552(-)